MLSFRRKPRPTPPAPAPGAAAWYGKLPTLGDFASRRMPADWIEAWDQWLAHGLSHWREQHAGWLDEYLAGPCWRFLFAPATLAPGAPALAGALLPSVDAVGRYYPLVLAHPLAAWPPTEPALGGVLDWSAPLAQAATEAMLDDWPVDRLEEALARLGTPSSSLGDDALPRWATAVSAGQAPARSASWWWHEFDDGQAEGVATGALPQGEAFRHLVAGRIEALDALPTFQRL